MLELLGLTLTLQHMYDLLVRFCDLGLLFPIEEEHVNIATAAISCLLASCKQAHNACTYAGLVRPYD